MASNILSMEFNSQDEDVSFEPKTEDQMEEPTEEEVSQDQTSNQPEEEESLDMDQVPVGTVKFEQKNKKGEKVEGEAYVFAGEDEKVTTINEMVCNETLDEDDFIYEPKAEEVEKAENSEDEQMEGETKEEEGEEGENQGVDKKSDEAGNAEEEDDEDLKNVEAVPQTEIKNEDLVKLKFKDVEEWKKNNKQEEEPEPEVEEEKPVTETTPELLAEAEGMEETAETPEQEEEAETEYNEEEDKDYNPIYNDETLSDVEEPIDENDEDLQQPEVVYTSDEFCMLKVPNENLVQDSREEMECC